LINFFFHKIEPHVKDFVPFSTSQLTLLQLAIENSKGGNAKTENIGPRNKNSKKAV
jgi:hypothetical protein